MTRAWITLGMACLWLGVEGPPSISWTRYPSVPDVHGLGGAMAGRIGLTVVIAGGTHFDGVPPWDGGRKRWFDTILALPESGRAWQTAGKLPGPRGYGVSYSIDDGVLIVGGADETQHLRSVVLIQNSSGRWSCGEWPALPEPCALGCGARVGSRLYLAGGTSSPDATTAGTNFWSLDLEHRERGWERLPSWPGPARMLGVAGSDGTSFYLFSGASLAANAQGQPVRSYLRDAYRYTPGQGWKRLADMPRPAVAAASPAPQWRQRLLLLSGDDGSRVDFQPRAQHPGFPRDLWAYDPARDRWEALGETPFSRATLPTVALPTGTLILSGEIRPGVRSPEVWLLGSPARP